MSDTLGRSQAQEEGEGGGPEQGAGRHPEDDRARESSGRRAMQNWRVCPLSAPPNRLKGRHGVSD